MKRSGIADLPLHGGRVPEWLAHRMTRLGTAITRAIVYDYGTSAFLSRLSDPFWFQAFGAVMGMDWHSSGITTSVMGALKRGLASSSDELGLYVCGGRGRFSRDTPNELRSLSYRLGCDGEALLSSPDSWPRSTSASWPWPATSPGQVSASRCWRCCWGCC